MNFNDLENKRKRLITATGGLVDNDTKNGVKINQKTEHVGSGLYSSTVMFTFGKRSQEQIQNKVMEICDLIYKMKDVLKNKMQERSLDSDLVDKYIESSVYIKIAIDFSNMDKHGEVLKKKWCPFIPKINNLREILRINNGQVTLGLNGTIDSANASYVIEGDILDENGNKICSVEDLISKSIEEWDNFINSNG